MSSTKPKLCVLAATPLTIHFFLKPHLQALSQHFEVSLVCNFDSDKYLPQLDLPVRSVSVAMERKIAPLSDWRCLFALWGLFRRERFDVVVSVVPKAGLLGMLAAKLVCVPVRVHIFQGQVWASRQGAMRWLLRRLDTLVASLASHVLAVSASERQFLEAQGVAPVGKIQVLGAGSICGVDSARFKSDTTVRQTTRQALGVPVEATVCIYVGRLAVDKGVFDLVRAFIQVAPANPRLWLLLVGPDEDGVQDRLLQLAGLELQQRVRFHGFTSSPERFMAAADFLCLPSYREGFGMVILEAAAAGIPAIGSHIYGVTDALEDGKTGILFPPADVGALAQSISTLCTDQHLRSVLAVAAKRRVDTMFMQGAVVARYVDYLREISRHVSEPLPQNWL